MGNWSESQLQQVMVDNPELVEYKPLTSNWVESQPMPLDIFETSAPAPKKVKSKKKAKPYIVPTSEDIYQLWIFENEGSVTMSYNKLLNAHYRDYQKEKKRVAAMVQNEMKAIRPIREPVEIVFTMYVKNGNSRVKDASNIAEKLYEDALVRAGLIEEDSMQFVVGIHKYLQIDRDRPRLEVEIIPARGREWLIQQSVDNGAF